MSLVALVIIRVISRHTPGNAQSPAAYDREGVPMNRRLCAAAALVLAVAGLTASEGRAQVPVPAGRSIEPAWQAERTFHLNRIIERARASFNDTLLRVEIGTLAPIDVDATRQAVAQMDA